jgi:IclR family acetate operon transcriptional repressor
MSLDRRYVVTPVHKSMQLLDALVAGKGPMTLSDLASCTALPKTTAFRYLYTLRASGFVEYDERTERYLIGPRVAVSAPLPDHAERIREVAQPTMRRLQRQFNETVNLGIRDGQDIVYIDMVGSTRLLHTEAKIGKRDPLHSTALGKAILLTMGSTEVDRSVPRRMMARTPHTITDRDRFFDELALSAQRHYALDMEENELGARCVAAAICAPGSGAAIAAISISGPSQLMTMDTLDRMGRALARSARSIDLAAALN